MRARDSLINNHAFVGLIAKAQRAGREVVSRHQIPALLTNHICIVGYDRGMKTFFATVEDNEIQRLAFEAADRVSDAHNQHIEPSADDVEMCEREALIFWIGADKVGQVPTVEALAEHLKPYAEISEEMLKTLRGDQQREEETPRSRFQLEMQQFITENSRN